MVLEPRAIQFWSRSAPKFARNSPKPLRGRRTPHRGELERVWWSELPKPCGAETRLYHSPSTICDAPWPIGAAARTVFALCTSVVAARRAIYEPTRAQHDGCSKPIRPIHRQNGIGAGDTNRGVITVWLQASGNGGGRRGGAACKVHIWALLDALNWPKLRIPKLRIPDTPLQSECVCPSECHMTRISTRNKIYRKRLA